MPRLRVLISHATEEKALAEAWKDLITTTSSGAVEVWFSSDTAPSGGMALGIEWRTHLYERLAESDFVIAIQTPATAGRPWIMWECGVASGVEKVRRIIPITFSIGRSGLGNPLTSYQVYQGEDAEQVQEVCARLAEEAELSPPSVIYETAIDTYLEAFKLHPPRKGVSIEQIALWKDRYEELIRSGRVGEIPARRQAMYTSLGQPFEPVDPALHELLSRTLLDNGEFAAAIEEVDYGLRLVGRDVDLLHRKALALVEMQDLPGAEDLIGELLAQNPELQFNPELASLEGRIHRERWQVTSDRGELDRAFEAYLRAYRADRTQYYPGINAGSLALARGEAAQAGEIFREVLDTCRDLREHTVVSYWVDFSAGEAHLGLGDVEEAMSDYQRGLARTPAPPSRDRSSAIKGARRMIKAKGIADSAAERVERILT
jgi:tetratricopeptide (TPR) repeat protein